MCFDHSEMKLVTSFQLTDSSLHRIGGEHTLALHFWCLLSIITGSPDQCLERRLLLPVLTITALARSLTSSGHSPGARLVTTSQPSTPPPPRIIFSSRSRHSAEYEPGNNESVKYVMSRNKWFMGKLRISALWKKHRLIEF